MLQKPLSHYTVVFLGGEAWHRLDILLGGAVQVFFA